MLSSTSGVGCGYRHPQCRRRWLWMVRANSGDNRADPPPVSTGDRRIGQALRSPCSAGPRAGIRSDGSPEWPDAPRSPSRARAGLVLPPPFPRSERVRPDKPELGQRRSSPPWRRTPRSRPATAPLPADPTSTGAARSRLLAGTPCVPAFRTAARSQSRRRRSLPSRVPYRSRNREHDLHPWSQQRMNSGAPPVLWPARPSDARSQSSYSLLHLGYTIWPEAYTGWLGEAGPPVPSDSGSSEPHNLPKRQHRLERLQDGEPNATQLGAAACSRPSASHSWGNPACGLGSRRALRLSAHVPRGRATTGHRAGCRHSLGPPPLANRLDAPTVSAARDYVAEMASATLADRGRCSRSRPHIPGPRRPRRHPRPPHGSSPCARRSKSEPKRRSVFDPPKAVQKECSRGGGKGGEGCGGGGGTACGYVDNLPPSGMVGWLGPRQRAAR